MNLDITFIPKYLLNEKFKKLKHDPRWNLGAAKVMLTTHIFVKEIMMEFLHCKHFKLGLT